MLMANCSGFLNQYSGARSNFIQGAREVDVVAERILHADVISSMVVIGLALRRNPIGVTVASPHDSIRMRR
jgi:hypothetical protein